MGFRHVKIVMLAQATAGCPWPSADHATGEVQLTTFNGKIVYRNGNSSNQGVQQ